MELVGSILSFAVLGLLIYGLFKLGYALIFGNTASLSFYFLVTSLGLFVSPAVLMATAMGSASGEGFWLVGLFFYGCIAGMVLAILGLLAGAVFAMLGKSDASRKVLKVPIVYGCLWLICFLGVSLVYTFFGFLVQV